MALVWVLVVVLSCAVGVGCKKPQAAPPASPAPQVNVSEGTSTETGADLSGKNVLMVVAPKGIRAEEYREPRSAFEGAGAKVTVASVSAGEAILTDKTTIAVDIAAADADPAKFDVVIFVGGPGMAKHLNEPSFVELARKCKEREKIVVGAICVAPAILAHAGLLNGKKATAWRSQLPTLKAAGATIVDSPVVRDGNIVTANGPPAAKEFARTLVAAAAEL